MLEAAAQAANLPITNHIVDAIIRGITENKHLKLAAYHAQFIVDQVAAACRYAGRPLQFETNFIAYAIDNLRVERSDSASAALGESWAKAEPQ